MRSMEKSRAGAIYGRDSELEEPCDSRYSIPADIAGTLQQMLICFDERFSADLNKSLDNFAQFANVNVHVSEQFTEQFARLIREFQNAHGQGRR